MSDVIQHTKTMSISHTDFMRTFENAFRERTYEVNGSDIIVGDADGTQRTLITLGPEGSRQIALLRLPCTEVTFRFEGKSAGEVEEFIEFFDKHFRRGGG